MSFLARKNRFAAANGGYIIPILLGLALYFAFMALLEGGVFNSETLVRYVTGHWISRLTVAMAFAGLSALGIHAWAVWRQRRYPFSIDFNAEDVLGDEKGRAEKLLDVINQHRARHVDDYRWRRFVSALEFIQRQESVDGLSDELKYLSDMDANRQTENYGFVRIIIWATPLLGFLGTVLGISQALGTIQLGPDNDFQQMMNGLRGNLNVAFDTTALALTLSMGLMFIQFVVNRAETQLLNQVDTDVQRQLGNWFSLGGRDGDTYVRTVQRIGRSVLAATHEMSQRQLELWRQSIESAQAAWMQTSQSHYELVQSNLGHALDESLDRMAVQLTEAVRKLDQCMEQRGGIWQDRLVEVAQQIAEQQRKTVEANNQLVAHLEGLAHDSRQDAGMRTSELVDSLNLLSARIVRYLNRSDPHEPDADPESTAGPLRVVREDQAA